MPLSVNKGWVWGKREINKGIRVKTFWARGCGCICSLNYWFFLFIQAFILEGTGGKGITLVSLYVTKDSAYTFWLTTWQHNLHIQHFCATCSAASPSEKHCSGEYHVVKHSNWVTCWIKPRLPHKIQFLFLTLCMFAFARHIWTTTIYLGALFLREEYTTPHDVSPRPFTWKTYSMAQCCHTHNQSAAATIHTATLHTPNLHQQQSLATTFSSFHETRRTLDNLFSLISFRNRTPNF